MMKQPLLLLMICSFSLAAFSNSKTQIPSLKNYDDVIIFVAQDVFSSPHINEEFDVKIDEQYKDKIFQKESLLKVRDKLNFPSEWAPPAILLLEDVKNKKAVTTPKDRLGFISIGSIDDIKKVSDTEIEILVVTESGKTDLVVYIRYHFNLENTNWVLTNRELTPLRIKPECR